MTKKPRENRVPIMMSDDELRQIDDWRFANRIATRSDAVRRLAQMGLILSRSFEGIRSAGTDTGKGLLSFDEKRLAALFEIEDINELRDRLADILTDAAPAVEAQERLLKALHGLIVPILEMRIEIVDQPFDELIADVKKVQDEANRLVAEYKDRKNKS